MRLLLADTELLNDKTRFERYYKEMNFQRQEKITLSKQDEDKKRILTAGILLQYFCRKNGINNPEYIKNHQGKPALKEASLEFNLSHSGKYAVCAYGKQPVGVDIQEKRVTSEAMVGRFLNHMEMEELPEDLTERIIKVNRLWCIKESYVKLIGLGLAYDMRECIVDLKSGHVIDVSGRYDAAYFKEYPVEDNYHLAVSCMSRELPEKVEKIELI